MTGLTKNALATAIAALTLGVTVAATSTPAAAHGGGFGGFGLFQTLSGMTGNGSSGTVYDASGTPATGAQCRNEKQKLYDDDDNVVGTRVVRVCPVSQQ